MDIISKLNQGNDIVLKNTFIKKNLEKNGINATLRREMGRDIDGACGQLRRKYVQQPAGKLMKS